MSGPGDAIASAAAGVALGAAAGSVLMDELADRFRDIDASDLPPLEELDERGRMFWVLRVGSERLELATMTPGEISVVLRDAYGVDLSRQRIEATLNAESGTVAKRRKGGRRAYQLMAKGSAELDGAAEGATFIDPASGFTGLQKVRAMLGGLAGELRVCDPYIDGRTLDMLAECTGADSIRLLTRNIKTPDGLKQRLTALAKELGVSIEVRKAPDKVLHDRYAIDDDGMLILGTSLNGLGLKQSLVVSLGEDVRLAALAAFEATWDKSAAFWPPS